MNQGRRELVRFVRSLEAQKEPRRELEFSSLPVRTMMRHTVRRIFQSISRKLNRSKADKMSK